MALPTGPLNALPPKTSFIVGAVFNSTPPTPTPGQGCALQVDSSGNLKISGTFSGGNAAAGLTGSAVPTSADYIGFNSGGLLVGVSAANPLPISGSISATNPSVGPTGSAVPADATAIGVEDGSGNLQIASGANPVRVDPTGTTIQPVNGTIVAKGNVASGSAVSGSNAPVLVAGQDGTDVRTVLTSSTGQLHVIVDSGGGGGTQYTDGTAESAGAFTGTVAMLYNGTDVVGLRGDASNNLLVKVNVALPAGTNVIGHVIVDSGTITTVSTVTAITNAVTVIGDAANGAAVVGNPVLVGGSDGTDARTISTNASGQLVVVGAGTAGSGSGGVLSVQGVASGVTLPVTATIAASQTIAVTQATASSLNATVSIAAAQTLATVTTVGAVTAITNALPAGTNLIGQVEVSDGTNVLFTSGHPGYVQGTVAVTNFANPLPTLGNSATQQTATWTSSTTSNTAITASAVGYSTVLITLAQTGNCLGLGVAFEASDTVAGTNWYGIYGVEDQTSSIPVNSYICSTNTSAHSFLINVAGWNQFRLRVYSTTVQSGSLVAAFTPQTAPCTQFVGVVNTVTLGAGNALIGEVKLSDGTNTMGTMTVFGTTPTGSANALVTNASLFQGTAAISATNPLVTEIGDGTHTVTLNSTTYSSKYGLDVNLLGTLGTAFTTAGFVDIKGADGNVFVRQTTGSNLHTVVDSGTITAVTAITNALPAGSNTIGAVTQASGPWTTTQTPATTGGCSIFLSGALTTTVASVKSSAGQLFGWFIGNPNAVASFVQIFNTASGSVSLGSTTPILSLMIPASGSANLEIVNGLAFGTAISVACTTTYNGNTAPSTGLTVNLWYK